MRLAIVLMAAMALPGCLFDRPLVPGTPEPVDARLVGAWRCVAPDAEEPAILTVTGSADRRYRAELAGKDEKPSIYSAQAVAFEGKRLLNVQEIEDGTPKRWTVVRYTLLRPDALHIEAADEKAFEGASTDAQRLAAMKRALAHDALFSAFCTCVRIPKK